MNYMDAIKQADMLEAAALRLAISAMLDEARPNPATALLAIGTMMCCAMEFCLREGGEFNSKGTEELAQAFARIAIEFTESRLRDEPTVH